MVSHLCTKFYIRLTGSFHIKDAVANIIGVVSNGEVIIALIFIDQYCPSSTLPSCDLRMGTTIIWCVNEQSNT